MTRLILQRSIHATNSKCPPVNPICGGPHLRPAENAALLAPISVKPALPLEISPGASQTITITFPKPSGKTAMFKILDFSGDIYF